MMVMIMMVKPSFSDVDGDDDLSDDDRYQRECLGHPIFSHTPRRMYSLEGRDTQGLT
jgi:hypothetical protein